MTRLNTIVPPNSTDHPWNDCCQGGGGGNATFAADHPDFGHSTSNHFGGYRFAFGDGSVTSVKGTIKI